MQKPKVQSLGREDPLKDTAAHSRILAWEISWTEEPGRLQSVEYQNSWICLSEFFPVAQMVKIRPAMWETWVWSLGWEDSLEEGMETHSSILAWRIPVDRGAWHPAVHRVAESDAAEWLSAHTQWLNNKAPKTITVILTFKIFIEYRKTTIYARVKAGLINLVLTNAICDHLKTLVSLRTILFFTFVVKLVN